MELFIKNTNIEITKAIIRGALTILKNLIPDVFNETISKLLAIILTVISPASNTERGAVSTNILGNRFKI